MSFIIKKIAILTLLFTIGNLFASGCGEYYNPKKFYSAPTYLKELIEQNIENKDLELFGEIKNYKKLNFSKNKKVFLDKSSTTNLNEYQYPIKTGLWKFTIKNNQIDEINIAVKEYYKFDDAQIANEINENFEEFWSDWIENAYSMKLIPEETLFKYKRKYFSFSVFIYGIKGDASKLKTTVVSYWFKDFTAEVNRYIKCKSKNKKTVSTNSVQEGQNPRL